MNTAVNNKFPVKPVVAALALALSAATAYAAPTPIQQPGAGLIRAVTNGTYIMSNTSPTSGFCVAAGCLAANKGIVGDQIWDGYADSQIIVGSTANLNARAVITWGAFGGSLETRNPGGFNVGASAHLTFTTDGSVTSAAVLNVDTSGNPSQIFGLMEGSAGLFAVVPSIYVANANGIIVGPSAHIVAPSGVGLIGANLNNALAWNDFIGNNTVVPADPTTPGTSYLNVTGTMAPVMIAGFIDGNAIANAPAPFILIAGSNVTNTGNLFAGHLDIAAGVSAPNSKATVNGQTNQTVNRFWNVNTGSSVVQGGLGTCATCVEVLAANAGSAFVNTGSMSVQGDGNWIGIEAANGIRSGTKDDTNPLVGIFNDGALVLTNFDLSGTSSVSLYNVVSGYTQVPTPNLIDFVAINQQTGGAGDVNLKALTRASQGSSVFTEGPVTISGKNVLIESTINHVANTADFADSLVINASNSLVTTAAIGAGENVVLTNTGAGGINIGGNVTSNLDGGVSGYVQVSNTNNGAATTISGIMQSLGTSNGASYVSVDVNGALNISGAMGTQTDDIVINNNKANAATSITSPLIVAGLASGLTDGDIYVTVKGPLAMNTLAVADRDISITNNSLAGGTNTTLDGAYAAGGGIWVTNNGPVSSNLVINGDLITTGAYYSGDVNVWSGGNLVLGMVNAYNSAYITAFGLSETLNGAITANSEINYSAAYGITKAKPAALLTAPTINLEVLTFQGVNASGNAYVNAGQKPTEQFKTDELNVVAYGSFNAPIAGVTDWPKNALGVTPYNPGDLMFFDISAVGGGFQAINVKFNGDVVVTSGATQTPFQLVGLTSSILVPPGLTANGGSQMILAATGNMDINGTAGPLWPLAPFAFQFPGGLAFIAGGYISQNAPVYNAWTEVAQPYQGIFYQAPTIIASSYNATNANSWVNYSSYPVTGPSQAFVISQTAPGLYQFVNYPDAIHNNTYTRVINGGAFCTTPNPAAPWSGAC